MWFFLVLVGAPFLLGLVPGTAATTPLISAIGSKFFDSNGNQFFIKGVAYLPAGSGTLSDPLTDTTQCTLDAALMSTLGANTIRVYAANSSVDHSGCMSAFEESGIYVLVNLDSPTSAIGRVSPSWTTSQFTEFSALMDSFANYSNTLGFFVGNEVINNLTNSDAAPYIKAAAVDLKSYRNSKGYREIPVGYSGSNEDSLRPYLQNYLACGSNSIDFFGQNQYSWCDPSSFTISGYDTVYANASKYSVPIFLSETGCNINPPRKFDDQAAIFGPEMNDEWSGAVIYEWALADNGYGIVSYGPSSETSGTPIPKSPDFTNLQSQWATLTPTGTPIISYDLATITPPACPTSTSNGWLVNGDVKLPTLMKVVSVTSSSSVSRSNTGSTHAAPTSFSGSQATSTDFITSTADRLPSTGPSTGAKAGFAVGAILFFVLIVLAAFLLRRWRTNEPLKKPLDLSPEGLEVGMAPPKQEHDNPSISTQEAHTHASELGSPTGIPAELGYSTPSRPHPDSIISTVAELSPTPATPKVSSASPTKTLASSIPRRAVPSSTASSSWANAPWHSEDLPTDTEREAKAQEVPLLTTNEEEDELSRIEAEERRIDAQIAESERIRALKAEKAALQAKKAELLAKRESSAKT